MNASGGGEFNFGNPPPGAWYRETREGGFVIGGSTRTKAAYYVAAFAAVWSLVTYHEFVGPYFHGKLLGPAVVMSLAMGALALCIIGLCLWMLLGKVQVSSDGKIWTMFTGVGCFGSKQTVSLAEISQIRQELAPASAPDEPLRHQIVLGSTGIALGQALSDERREFLAWALQRILEVSPRDAAQGSG